MFKKMKMYYVCILAIIIAISYFAVPQVRKKFLPKSSRFSISGAFDGGVYHQTAKHLVKHLNHEFENDYEFHLQESSGSVENISNLQDYSVDISLVQEDVAHYYYRGGHSLLKVDHEQRSHLKAICFLFHEHFVVLARPGKKTLADLHSVNIGSLYGGSGVTAMNIRDQLQYHWEFNMESPIIAMKNDTVDAVIVITPNVSFLTKKLRENNIDYHPIGLNNKEISSIVASFPFYHKAHVEVNNFDGKKKIIQTISTRSLLAAHNHVPSKVINGILEIFTKHKQFEKFVSLIPEIKNLEMDIDIPEKDRLKRFGDFPIPIHPLVFELQRGKLSFGKLFIAIFPLISLCFILLYLRFNNRYKALFQQKMFHGVLLRDLFRDLWVYIFLIASVLLYLMTTIYFIKYLEVQSYINNEFAQPSKFIDMKFSKLMTWIFVFTVAGYEDETFPYTELGKVLASSIRIVTISSMMFIFGRLSVDYLKNLLKERKMYKGFSLQNHIVICNWNSKGPKIIQEIHSPMLKDHNMAKPVVVLCNHEIEFPDSDAFQDTFFLPGDPTSEWKLRNASINNAFSIIILADETMGDQADSYTVMIVMEMIELFDTLEKENKLTRKPHISAELIDGKNIKYLKRAGVDEVISSNDLGVRLLAQSTVTPGITEFMDNILQYCNQTNEIYIIDAPMTFVEQKLDFVQLSTFFIRNRERYHNTVLMAIQRKKSMMVNPSKEEFQHLEEKDRLVILAKKRPILDL